MKIPIFRIGQGYDAHRFIANKKLILGGVEIQHEYGLLAHSDGDVLIHALCDALLGALALGDIGQHFPDNQQQYHQIDSRVLLKAVIKLILAENYQLANADMTLIAEVPKLAPYIHQMGQYLAADCQVEPAQISVKATTTEKMGFCGRKEGIAAQAIVLLQKNND